MCEGKREDVRHEMQYNNLLTSIAPGEDEATRWGSPQNPGFFL